MNAEVPGKLSKFQRYRARKTAAGYTEVRRCVRDPNSPRFKAEMEAYYEHQAVGVPGALIDQHFDQRRCICRE
jgi:hypothetical protein